MKKPEVFVRDYLSKLPDKDISELLEKISERLQGDLVTVLDYLSKNQEMDKWLREAKSGREFFSMVDMIQDCLDAENRDRQRSRRNNNAYSWN
jgi:hypothetical protein